MASACVNSIGVSPEFPTYGCFNPRAPFSAGEDGRGLPGKTAGETRDAAGDFEFRPEYPPVKMPHADELFSGGKLVPLQRQQPSDATDKGECRSMEDCLFSPKAPRCSSRWREILGLKRFSQNSKTTSSLKQLLHRSSRPSSSDGLPLLKDSDSVSISISSAGHGHDDLPRLSLDSERPNHHNLDPNPFAPARSLHPNPPRMRLVKARDAATGTGRVGRSPMRSSRTVMSRGVSVDSPRLNSSGKIVFQSLERSSSSPSSFNGGASGYRHRSSTERSYTANVRVTPVLNVPVCSLVGQFFSSSLSSSSSSSSSQNHHRNIRASSHHHHHQYGIVKSRNSTDRI